MISRPTKKVRSSAADTMNPVQREFIRLAQIFKSQMIAEVELKQRVVERGLIQEQRFNDLEREAQVTPQLRQQAQLARNESLQAQFNETSALLGQLIQQHDKPVR